MKNQVGLDEAGRGAMLGSLFMAGVKINLDDVSCLQDLHVMDSKQFGSNDKAKKKRAEISQIIQQNFEYDLIEISSQTVDQYVQKNNLNLLERENAQKIIKRLPAQNYILDGENIFKALNNKTVRSENKADTKYLSVMLASILAKNARDVSIINYFNQFKKEFGLVKGGGYANQGTIDFIVWYKNKYNKLPDVLRTSYQYKKLNAII